MHILVSLLLACGAGPTEAPEATAEVPTEAPAEAPAPDGGQQEVDDGPSASPCMPAKSATWDACDGETVTVDGTVATDIYNHPSADGPVGPPGGAQPPKLVTWYLDAGSTQIVVRSPEAPTCKGTVTATGRIELVDLGGEPGTRGEYRGLKLTTSSVACK